MRLDEAVEFAENPEPRCPCVLLLDTSGSMSGEPIKALNDGLRIFNDSLAEDPRASRPAGTFLDVNLERLRTLDDVMPPNVNTLFSKECESFLGAVIGSEEKVVEKDWSGAWKVRNKGMFD